MKSIVIEGMLREELERNQRMSKRYRTELNSLPKGTIIRRIKNNEIYFYLHYRENSKVVSKYLGKENVVDLVALENQLKKRKNIVEVLRRLKIEEKELLQILAKSRNKKRI